MKKGQKIILLIFLAVILALFSYFFIGFPEAARKISWGVNFSQKHAENLGLDWRENYLALLDDLGAKNLKIAAYWDLIEPEQGSYHFEDLDWQIEEAEKREAGVLLVIGAKVPRWPECHQPYWVWDLELNIRKQRLLEYIEKIVNRYKNSRTLWAWQVENEPFFPFGECPGLDKELLKKEIALVKSLDNQRPIIISESGEFPLWIRAAGYGDMLGVTIYKKVWFEELNLYISYPFPPIFYRRKAALIKKIFNKKVICIELQTEPWGPELLYSLSLEEQEKTMNLERFEKNIEFARKTGFDAFYLWGAEWWYWLKTKENQPEIWQEAEKLF